MPDRFDVADLTPPIPPEMRGIVGAGGGASGASGVRGVGQPGKVGLLRAQFVAGRGGRTGLRGRFAKAPLSVSRPLYIDATRPHHAYLYTRTTGGGLAENDRVRQIVDVEDGACATVTTQAATNVHRMNAGCATQWTTFTVGQGAVLEYLPGHTTLFGGSRLVQSTEFRLAASATLLAVETVMLGRVARCEEFAFDALSQALRVERDGRPLLSDITCCAGAGEGVPTAQSELLFGPWPVWTTLVVVPAGEWCGGAGSGACATGVDSVKRLAEDLTQRARTACGGEGGVDGTTKTTGRDGRPNIDGGGGLDVQWGISTLAGDSGVLIRVAGSSTWRVKGVVDALYDAARRAVLGVAAVDLRTM